MTDIVALTNRLFRKINSQNVPIMIDKYELIDYIKDAIRSLYVISGRELSFSEDMFIDSEIEGDAEPVVTFDNDMSLAESEWVLLKAQIEFYKWVQASVDDQTSYTTDAMSLTHGDKPYEHIGQTIDRLQDEMNVIWTRLVRYNQLGVAG